MFPHFSDKDTKFGLNLKIILVILFIAVLGLLVLLSMNTADAVSYGVSFDKNEGYHTVSPEHDSSGETNFSLEVTNEGDSQDTFVFEFKSDESTQKYGKWVALPDSIILDPEATKSVQFDIRVNPYESDNHAVADGRLKDINISVYSKGARDNNQEIEGVTTDSYRCGVDIEEYRYAVFTSIEPSSVTMDGGDTEIINVTLKNEGNGDEEYKFIKDGKRGSGQFMHWYDFNVTKMVIGPGNSTQVSIELTPDSDAPVGIHDLEFHADSETTYDTSKESFRVEIEEKFGGQFVSGSNKRSDPGMSVDLSILVRNTGNAEHEFYLDDPSLPIGWVCSWPGGSSKSISADSSSSITIRITIPTDYTKAEAGVYQFQVTGEYEDEGGTTSPIPGSAYLNVTVNTVYGVEVNAEETTDKCEPREYVTYRLEVRNTGNANDTYQLSILKASGYDDAAGWATIQGADPDDKITLSVGVTGFLDVVVDVPDFTPENDEAKAGLFGLKFQAESTNDSGEKDEIVLELDVEELYGVRPWSDIQGKNETLKENDDTEMTYTISVRNLGNTNDNIVVNVPNDEFSGDKKDWSAKIDGQSSKTLSLASLQQTSVTLNLTIDNKTDPGEYTLNVRAESQGDTSVYAYTTIFINLTKVPIAIIDSISPDPSIEGQEVHFVGIASAYEIITRYVWSSNIDNELYNGTNDNFKHSNLSIGNHTITFIVQDENGLWSKEVNSTLIVHLRPKASIISISPNPALEDQIISFVGNGTDDGSIVNFIWTSSIDEEFYSGPDTSFTISDLSAGTHTIQLKVQDNRGVWSDEVSANLEIIKDTDDDGIGDNSDAFPDDPAASKDSDGDGYPDDWNEGKTESESTTGLKLDEYPDDPKIWKKEEDESGLLSGFEVMMFILVITISIIFKRKERE